MECPSARLALFVVLGIVGACRSSSDVPAPPPTQRESRGARFDAARAKVAADTDDPLTELDTTPDKHPAEGIRADFRAFHPAKAEALGWYPLVARASIPSFAKGSKNAAAARDDDLLTAWTCPRGKGAMRCALSLHFPESVEVTLIRVFPSLGATQRDRRGLARVKSLRIHTGAGWIDASLRDWWTYQHIQLDKAVTTKALTLEITDVYPGDRSPDAGLAEVEVYGTKGPRRKALELDPRAVAVRGSPGFYRNFPEKMYFPIPYRVAPTWIEVIDGDGGARRIVGGTALYGRPGDRYLLVARLLEELCTLNGSLFDGRFAVIDRERRALFDAGELGGIKGAMWRHASGRGFATASDAWDRKRDVFGFFLVEKTRIVRKSLTIGETGDVGFLRVFESVAKKNSFDLLRPQDESYELCKIISHRKAMSALPDKALLPATYKAASDQWRICDVGDRKLLILCGNCGPTRAVLLDEKGAHIPPLVKGDGAGFDGIRLRRLPDSRMLVETSRGLYVVTRDSGMELRYEGYLLGLTRTNLCSCECCGGSYRGEERQ